MSELIDYVKGDYAGLARRLRNFGGQVFRFDAADAIETLLTRNQELERLLQQALSSHCHSDPDSPCPASDKEYSPTDGQHRGRKPRGG